MLHSTIVASEAASETSTRATRHRQTQVIPRASYSFGEDSLLPGGCIEFEPAPVRTVIHVHQGAVPPGSLPGGALPRATAVMPTGEMRGLGEPLATVPAAFRHGVSANRKAVTGDREVRRVGKTLVPMAPPMVDYERNPIGQDRRLPNRSATTSVLPNYGLAPDDKMRQKLICPVQPGMTVERRPLVYEQPGQAADRRQQYESRPIAYESPGTLSEGCIVPGSVEDMCGAGDEECRREMNYCRQPSRGNRSWLIGLAALVMAGGVYWSVVRED